MQRKVPRAEERAAWRLLGPVQLRAHEHGGEMLGDRDVHHTRGLHVPGQSGTVAGTVAGTDIDCNARSWHRFRGYPGRHQVLEELWQPSDLSAGHLPRILQQQARAKSGE